MLDADAGVRTIDRPLFAQAAMLLAGIAVLQTLAAVTATQTRMRGANAIGAAVCAIAALHYVMMHRSRDETTVWSYRYSDWYPTTLLLLLELFWLMHSDGARLSVGYVGAALALCVAMLCMGQLSRAGYPGAFSLGCVAGAATLAMVVLGTQRHGEPRRNAWAFAFLALWALYPVAALLPDAAAQASLTALDVLTKAVFGAVVALIGLPH